MFMKSQIQLNILVPFMRQNAKFYEKVGKQKLVSFVQKFIPRNSTFIKHNSTFMNYQANFPIDSIQRKKNMTLTQNMFKDFLIALA